MALFWPLLARSFTVVYCIIDYKPFPNMSVFTYFLKGFERLVDWYIPEILINQEFQYMGYPTDVVTFYAYLPDWWFK